MGFSVWDDTNVARGRDDTVEFFELLGIESVPELYRGPFDEKLLKKLGKERDVKKNEGFVVRLVGAIRYEDFAVSAAKWVRPKHVQTDEQHWVNSAIVANGLNSRR